MKTDRVFFKCVSSESERRSVNANANSVQELYKLKLIKTYLKGAIVKKTPGTPGIFCFKTREDAEDFSYGYSDIIRVKAIGRTRIPKSRIYVDSYNLRAALYAIQKMEFKTINDYIKKSPKATPNIPEGTICCDAVEVLE